MSEASRERIETDLGDVAGVSDQGYGHARNEDAMALGRHPDGAVAVVVCDGVSTSRTPRRAARAAADVALDVLLTGTTPAADRLRSAVAAAADAVAGLAAADDSHPPACTFVGALVAPAEVAVAWVGDSRAYRLDTGEAELLTTDHSWAAEMVAAGALDETTAQADARAHAITRWLGAGGEPDPEVVVLRPPGPGALLLCTDGLWNYLPDPDDLAEVALPALEAGGTLAAARALTDLALDAGGRDNITTAVVALRSAQVS